MVELNFTMVIQLAIVLSLMVILTKIVFRPFLSILQERRDQVEGAQKRARELQKRTAEFMERHREAIFEAQAQAEKTREKIRQESLAQEMEILKKSVEEANRLIQEMKMKIDQETEMARDSLRIQAQNLSREIAEKVFGRGLG
jgi:F-type H+-transporting ATPase subunit b